MPTVLFDFSGADLPFQDAGSLSPYPSAPDQGALVAEGVGNVPVGGKLGTPDP
jgi:hypothetical protein